MPKFMFQASYTPVGVKAMAREGGSKRRGAVGAAIEALGGRMESFCPGAAGGMMECCISHSFQTSRSSEHETTWRGPKMGDLVGSDSPLVKY